MRYSSKIMLLTGVAALFSTTSHLATAQDSDDMFTLEEIIVTAQKRSESVQDVPVAITAFTENMLKETGSIGINDVAMRTPGLDFENGTDLKLGGITLRGVGASLFSAGQDPAVGVYLDEVYLGNGVGARIDYFDVAGVEVLRGPQGTLFGRNTIAGVINVTSQRPTQEFEGAIAANYGNLDSLRLNAMVNGPIVKDKLSGRLTAYYDRNDGDTNNVFLGTKGHGGESFGIRAKLLLEPNDRSEFLLTFGYNEADNHPRNQETFSYSGGDFSLVSDLLDAFGLPRNEDPFDRNVYSNIQSQETLEAWNIALNARYDFDTVELVSVTSFRKHDYYNVGDTEMSPLDWVEDGDPENVKRFSQELRLVSNNEGAFNWIFGVYYFNQHTINESFVNFGSDFATVLELPGAFVSGSTAIMDVDSYATFAHVNYDITDKLKLTAGARYTHEKKSVDFTQDDQFGFLGGDIQNLLGNNSWGAFTPSVSLQYNFTDDIMTYATVSRGFKSGGYNDALGDSSVITDENGDPILNEDGEPQAISFNPEFMTNYEVGFKSKLFEDRVLFNMALYRMKWTDIQIRQDNPETTVFDPVIFNGGAAVSKGIEIEFTVLATQNLELGGNFTYQDAKYTEGVDLAGQPLGDFGVPDFTYSAYGRYDFDIANVGNLSFRLEYLYEDESLLDVTQTTLDTLIDTSHRQLNARIALLSDNETWEIALWGDNLTKEVYVEGGSDFSDNELVGQALIELSRPRTYGVEVRFKF